MARKTVNISNPLVKQLRELENQIKEINKQIKQYKEQVKYHDIQDVIKDLKLQLYDEMSSQGLQELEGVTIKQVTPAAIKKELKKEKLEEEIKSTLEENDINETKSIEVTKEIVDLVIPTKK